MNLIIAPGTSDEVTIYMVTDEIYKIIMKIFNCHEKFEKNISKMQDKIVEDIFEILENNNIHRIFAQTFCEEDLNWEYEIKHMLCLPVW